MRRIRLVLLGRDKGALMTWIPSFQASFLCKNESLKSLVMSFADFKPIGRAFFFQRIPKK